VLKACSASATGGVKPAPVEQREEVGSFGD
jgi:hypothetical protein